MPSDVPLAEMIDIAVSTVPLVDRARGVVESLNGWLPVDAIWLSLSDPESHVHATVGSSGLERRVLEYVDRPTVAREIQLDELNQDRPPISSTELPIPIEEHRTWAECLIPAGFRDALAVPLVEPGGPYVGMLSLLYSSAASDAFLAGYGLTRGELDVLSALRRSDKPLSPTSLAQTLLAPRSAITMRLNALEARELLSRSANPTDGRSSLLVLTDSGAALVDEVIPAQLAFEDALLAQAPPGAIEGLAARLRALTSVWEQGRGHQAGSSKDRREGGVQPDG